MPIPFDDLGTENSNAGAIAWFRLVEEEGGTGVRAALFQTSGQGDPLDFCFARADHIGIPRQRGTVGPDTLSSLVKSLFQSVTSSPMLIFGLADEWPPSVFADDISVRLPLCRVRNSGTLTREAFEHGDPANSNGRFEMLWLSEQPHWESRASRLLAELMERDNPFEPFERAETALAVAFEDERLQAMTGIAGLATVVRLSSLDGRPEYPADRSSAVHESVQTPTFAPPRSDLTLAARLWEVLAAPLERGQDFQLNWPGQLMPFQRDGVRALLDNRRLLLADDMGLGKTIQAIAAFRILRARREIKTCLLAAPASLLDQWRREIEKWAPELTAIIIRGSASDRSWQWAADRDVTLVSYDTLRSDFGGTQSPALRKNWDVVVADEAQRIKNRNDTSDALKGLRRTRSWALTGTPIENHEEELASILEFVDHDGSEGPKRYRPGAELRERHRELQLRRKKGEVLDDLPPKQVTKVAIDLHSKQRSSYDKAEQDGIVYLKSLGAEVGVQHVLTLITRLKQICNADPKTGESSKLADIKDRLEQLAARGHKALVFSQYTSDTSGVAAAANYLHEFTPLSMTGDIPQYERADIIERFKTSNEHKALILSLRVGGLGLNLQEASYVFHLDRWWNPAAERQAEDRSHRMGQTVKVNVIKYSCAGTIEERIDAILERKQELFDQLVDDVSLDLSTQMSSEELFGLFGLEQPPLRGQPGTVKLDDNTRA